MTSGHRLLIAAFALVVAGGAVLLARELSPPPRERPPAPPATPTPRPATPRPAANPAPTPPPRRRPKPTIEVTGPDGAAVKSPTIAGDFAKAPGAAWTRIPAAGPDGVRRVTLVRAGPAITLTVREADGSPAAIVPCTYPPISKDVPLRRTDGYGVLVIDDAPPGVLRVFVGRPDRGGPVLRLVVGRNATASATLDPPWTITGLYLGKDGTPTSGTVHAGNIGATGGSAGPDGRFHLTTRMEERLALTGYSPPEPEVVGEPPLPDPRGPLSSEVTLRTPAATALTVSRHEGDYSALFEPAVLAVARDVYGGGDVLVEPSVLTGRVPPAIPLRVLVRGDVVPEDHVVVPSADGTTRLRLSPQPAEPTPPPPPEAKDPAATGFIVGKVVDGTGAPLQGVTVDAGDGRATTRADGAFRIEGLVPGRTLDLVYAWLDGADPGSAHPKDFEPYGTARYSPSTKAITLPLRAPGALSMRIVDAMDDHPLSWAHVLLSDGEGGVAFDAAVATRDGRIDLEGLPVGPAGILAVLAPGYRREMPITLKPGKTTDLGVLRMSRGAKVVGVVRDGKGAPVQGAKVALLAEAAIRSGAGVRLRERDAFLRRGTTDAKGEVTIEGVDPSRTAGFAVWAEGLAPTTVRAEPAQPGEPMRFEAKVRKGGAVVLRITDPAGAPVSGAVVDVRSAVSGALYLDLVHRAALGTVIGSSEDVRIASKLLLMEDSGTPGRYRLGPLEPGPYELEVQRPGFKPLRWRFSVPDDGDDVPVAAQNEPGKIRLSTKSFGAIEWPVRLEPLAPEGK